MAPKRAVNFRACAATSSGGAEEVCGYSPGAMRKSRAARKAVRKIRAGTFKGVGISSLVSITQMQNLNGEVFARDYSGTSFAVGLCGGSPMGMTVRNYFSQCENSWCRKRPSGEIMQFVAGQIWRMKCYDFHR